MNTSATVLISMSLYAGLARRSVVMVLRRYVLIRFILLKERSHVADVAVT